MPYLELICMERNESYINRAKPPLGKLNLIKDFTRRSDMFGSLAASD